MDWRKKLTWREVVGLLALAVALGFAYQGIDKYIYRPCRIPLSIDTVFGRRVPIYVLVGLTLVLWLGLTRIRWFAEREIHTASIAIGICIGIAVVGVVFWCQ